MRISTLRRAPRAPDLPGVLGVARVDRRTKNLAKRVNPGDIAVIDHLDLDKVSADALVSAGVGAVVNASPSCSGRYPNLGPEVLVGAGVPLLDRVGPEVLKVIEEGEPLRLDGDTLYRGLAVVAQGRRLALDDVHAAMDEARTGLASQLDAFAGNTLEYLRQERALLLDGVGVPEIRTPLEGRQVLVVVRGYRYEQDLRLLRPYLRELRPVLIGVEGGADALLEHGYRPDLVVGCADAMSDEALACGAEIVVHADRDGQARGRERLEELGLPSLTFASTGTSEDVAMLLADVKGASLIVAVGRHATLTEFLDKGRTGMASTFVTRLRLGGKLVDAAAVARLHRTRLPTGPLVLLLVAGLFAMGSAMVAVGADHAALDALQSGWDAVASWFGGLR